MCVYVRVYTYTRTQPSGMNSLKYGRSTPSVMAFENNHGINIARVSIRR